MDEKMIRNAQNLISRAELASVVINNELYKEAMIIMEANLIEELRNSKFEEKDLREDIHKKLQVCQWFQKNLESIMTKGKYAEEKMSLWKKLKNNKNLRGL